MSKGCILVVDDNPINLKLAADLLEWADYHVLQAVDAEQVLVILEHTLPDLILLDIGLPGMDGLTLAGLLKSREATRAIPIVAITAFAMKGDQARVLKAGCDGYIAKPIDTRGLPAQVAKFIVGKDKPRPEPKPGLDVQS
jgi:CheY-like chemotaxis protein